MSGRSEAKLRRAEDAVADLDDAPWELTLFVSGASNLSARAIANATALCESHLGGRYHLDVLDVHDAAGAALASRVIATPTLVRTAPLPVRKIVGDLSHTDRVLLALELPVSNGSSAASDAPDGSNTPYVAR